MNKSAIALAVAAALAASASVQADTTLYGSARVSVDYFNPDSIKVLTTTRDATGRITGITERKVGNSDGEWDVANNSSRLGVRGSEDLGGGLSAIYQYEFGVDMTEGGNFNSNRPKLVGLKGGFGQISMGTQWTPYYNVLGVNDVFNSSRTFDTNYLGPFRFDNSVVYKTPNWAGFSLEGMLQMNSNEGRDGFDTWQVNALYENGPFLIGGVYLQEKGGCPAGFGSGSAPSKDCFTTERRPKWDQWGGAIAWSGERFGASLIYEYVNFSKSEIIDSGNKISDRWNINGVLEYSFGSNILRGSYAHIDNDDANSTDEWVVGYQYNLSQRSRLWVEYIGSTDGLIERTVGGEGFTGVADQTTFSVGMRHDF